MANATPHHVVAISGSLRRDSLNTALLRSLKHLAPETMDVDLLSVENIPLYSEELEGDNCPPAVTALRDAVARADGVVLASPEYNRGISGAMKNVLDWLSRPAHDGAMKGKNCVALVATESTYHGMGAWVQLAALVRHMNNHVVEPDLVIHSAHRALGIDSSGEIRLFDSWSADALRVQLESLESAIQSDLGGAILRAYDVFADRLYRPRRATMEYPLRLREIKDDEVESGRNPW
jgi:chromate reductase